jgi:hypothetical protein
MGGTTVSAVEELLDATTPDLGTTLDDVASFLRRYVVMSEAQVTAATLWVAHSHAFAGAEATPYLNVTSPERESGKTRMLEVLELLVARPWYTARTSSAALVRKLSSDPPATLLLDETDNTFKSDREYVAAVMSVLNAGYRRGGCSTLCVGQGASIEARDFPVFAPKAFAGIGALPDTVASRTIRVELKRRTSDERVERFRFRAASADAIPLHQALEAWASENAGRLADARPSLPDELSDRAQDVWEPLLAIAEMAGEEWGARARAAAIELSSRGAEEDTSVGAQLLGHIRDVFDGDRMTCAALVAALNGDDEMSYGGWNDGRGITTRELGKKLKPYRIRAKTLRLPEGTRANGYEREQFEDAWSRYAPLLPSSNHDSVTNGSGIGKSAGTNRDAEADVTVSKDGSNPRENRDATVVTVSDGGYGDGRGDGAPPPDDDTLFADVAELDLGTAPLKELHDAYLIKDGRCARHGDDPKPWCLECRATAEGAA